MKALVYGDLQATDGSERLFSNPAEPLQLWRVRKFYRELFEIYQLNRCNALWDLGDTFDDRNTLPMPAIDAVLEGLERFPASDYNLKIIGNHDQYHRHPEINIGRLFKPYFTVVEKTGAWLFEQDNVEVSCVSFDNNNERLAQDLVRLAKPHSGKKILLGHFHTVGCQTGGGSMATGVPPNCLDNFDLALLGHIHRPQSTGNVHCVGSPFQQDFGEAGEDKRVGVVDLAAGTVKWIKVTGFPRYATVSYAQFLALNHADSEDRLKVVLRTYEESEQFYAHRYSTRYEPVYDYQPAVSADAPCLQLQSRQALLAKYVSMATPESRNILLSTQEMVEYGEALAAAADAL